MMDLSYVDPRIGVPAAILLWLAWAVLALRDRKRERDSRHDRDGGRAADGVLTQRAENRRLDDGVQNSDADDEHDDQNSEHEPERFSGNHARSVSARTPRRSVHIVGVR